MFCHGIHIRSTYGKKKRHKKGLTGDRFLLPDETVIHDTFMGRMLVDEVKACF